MSAQLIFNGDFVLDVDSNIFIIASGKQIYNAGTGSSHPWQMSIWFDGQMANYAAGSGGITDAPVVSVSANGITAGSHNVQLVWTADTSLQLRGVNMAVLCLKR